jgi:hypothetical protein
LKPEVVCVGVVKTPQLLESSGIENPAILEAAGITTVVSSLAIRIIIQIISSLD